MKVLYNDKMSKEAQDAFLASLSAKFQGQEDKQELVAKKVELEKAWLKKRRRRVTSSAYGKLLTSKLMFSQAKIATNYIDEIITGNHYPKPQLFSKSTDWGNEHEPLAAIRFQEDTGLKLTNWGDGVEHGDGQEFFTKGEYAGGTPDGIIHCPTRGKGLLEIKCPSSTYLHKRRLLWDSMEKMKEEKDYYAQCQFSMWVMDLEWGVFMSYDPRWPESERNLQVKYQALHRDEPFIAEIEGKVKSIGLLIEEDEAKLALVNQSDPAAWLKGLAA